MTRQSICALAILLLIATAPGTFAQRAETDAPMAYLDGLTLITIEDGGVPALHRARNLIQSAGGRVAIMSPPNVLIGWIPIELRASLLGREGIQDITYTELVEEEVASFENDAARSMVRFFNAAVRGDIAEEQREFAQSRIGQNAAPVRQGDAFPRQPADDADYRANLESVGLDIPRLESRGLYNPPSRAVAGNSDRMTGTVALSIFFVESDGSGADPDSYTWIPEHMQNYLNGVATGLAWWASKAFPYTGCSVTFMIYYYSAADPRCQQWVEPILHNSSWESTWVNNILANFGYTSGTMYSRSEAFNTWQRSTYNTDRAYSAYVPYNYGGPPSFPGGATAYAYIYGPHTILLYNLPGVTTAAVFAHESGHIFGHCDEYADGCSSCGPCYSGYDNGNCESCNPNSRDCMMKYNDFTLCNYTPPQIGWGTVTPCTPTPPPPLPAPAVASVTDTGLLQGLTGTVTVDGTDFYPGLWVDFGTGIFVDKVTINGTTQIVADVTVINSTPPGLYDAEVTNRDFQSSVLPAAVEVLPTRQHYYSPSGNNVFPYITPANAATTLGDAIAAAFSGDTLYVTSGTLPHTQLDISTGVLLHGGWSTDFSTRDLVSGKTVLTLSTGDVTIYQGDFGGLDGFIVENGKGKLAASPYTNTYYGGGIRVLGVDAIIANCEIRNSAASVSSQFGIGGGIYAENAALDIRDNLITGNTATRGGGLYLYQCSGMLSGNTVMANMVSVTTQQPDGAGIFLDACSNLTLDTNVITGNSGGQGGGGILLSGCSVVTVEGGEVSYNGATFSGAGILARNSQGVIRNVDIMRNSGATLGGGVAADGVSNVALESARLLWNSAILGGGVYWLGGSLDATHNLFVGNNGTSGGGAMNLSSLSAGSLVGNTLDRNSASVGAGGISMANVTVEVYNNIVAQSTGDGISCTGSTPSLLDYNLVTGSSGSDYNGCLPGPDSPGGSPEFADTSSNDHHLGPNSRAIDAGRPGVAHQDPDGSRGDMGWYGSHALAMAQPAAVTNLTAGMENGDVVLRWDPSPEGDVVQYAVYCDTVSGFVPGAGNVIALIAAPDTSANVGPAADSVFYKVNAIDGDGYAGGYSNEVSPEVATSIAPSRVAYHDALYQNVPNPFNPVTEIRYQVSGYGDVELTVYDVAGRLVRRLVRGDEGVGEHVARWDGRDDLGRAVSSGVYFYRLRTPATVQTRKMILLK